MNRHWRICVICFGLAIAFCGGALWFYGFFKVITPDVIDHTSYWNQFYNETFSKQFWIPDEAQIISATHTSYPFMGGTDRVTFRLPNTKTPSQWAGLIAEKSKLGNFRQTEIWYDASHQVDGGKNKYKDTFTDTYFIRFLPNDRVYEAVWGWD